jgi:hypothetical protein
MEGRPICWYFNGSKAAILQKTVKNTTIDDVRKKFLKRSRIKMNDINTAIGNSPLLQKLEKMEK